MIKKNVALLLAMIFVLVPSYLLGAGAARADDGASAAVETIPPVYVSGGIDKSFQFNCEGHAYAWDIQVPTGLVTWDRSIQDTLNAFYGNGGSAQGSILKNATSEVQSLIQATYPTSNADDLPWVDEPQNEAFVRQLASALLAQGNEDNFNRFQDAELALSLVQSIPYVPNQFPRLAAQTLVDNGDCDDRSILLAGLLKGMGIDSVLQFYSPQALGLSFGHMNVGIEVAIPAGYAYDSYLEYGGSRYYVAETTNRTPIAYAFAEKPSDAYRVI